MIVGKVIGGGGSTAKTYILKTEDGQEIPAVLTEEEVDLTATANDIRKGTVAVTNAGVIEGTKRIPSYETVRGTKAVKDGNSLSITSLVSNNNYDYTQLQIIICAYNSSLSNSVSAEMVGIEGNVYNVKTTEALSSITKNHDAKSIDLNITNNTGNTLIIRFFTYKEVEDMGELYAYYYAEIDLETGECIGVQDRTDQENLPNMIPIPVYDEEYIFKYYINGNWYEDAEGTIPWQSSLI